VAIDAVRTAGLTGNPRLGWRGMARYDSRGHDVTASKLLLAPTASERAVQLADTDPADTARYALGPG